jgi:hypothetical protein
VAEENRVETAVGSTVRNVLGDEQLPESWLKRLQTNERRVRALVSSAEAAGSELERKGCAYAVIEGGGALLGSGLPWDAYGAGDLDILVQKGGHVAAAEVLCKAGFCARPRGHRAATERVEYWRNTGAGELWLSVGEVAFERSWIPIQYHDRSAKWLERRIRSDRSRNLQILHPDDAVVFVGIHTSMHSFVRSPGLRLYLDIDRLARSNRIDWQYVLAEANRVGLRSRVLVSLELSRALLGTPIPEGLWSRERRLELILALLRREGVFLHEGPKLRRGNALALDLLLEAHRPLRWLRDLVAPEERWLRARFERPDEHASVLRLRGRRLLGALSARKPR